MTLIALAITPFHIVGALVLFLVLFLTALFLLGKQEKGTSYFIWLIIILIFPIAGPLAYLLKDFAGSPQTGSLSES